MSFSRKYWGFIKDPLYGYIRITETEKKIMDTQPVQRLRRIRQLSGAEYVYPAANHTRFEHSLGAMYLAGIVAESLPLRLGEEEVQKIKMAALLHDVGHGPFSHVFEHLLIKFLNTTHEDIAPWIVMKSELADILKREGFDPNEIGKLSVGRLSVPRKQFLDQIIRSSIDVDKMDFVLRDSYHTGAGYGYVDVFRIIYTMDVLNGNLAVDVTAIPTLETFLLARLESFRAIYFHRAARAVQIMLVKALEQAKDELNFLHFKSPEDYLFMDDYTVWSALKKCEKSREFIDNIEGRKLWKCSYEKIFFARDELVTSVFTNEAVRKRIEEEIAVKAKVDLDNVVIDVPSLPSVPYYHAVEVEPMDIPVFYKTKAGKKVPQRIAELSKIVEVLRV
ncbi:MAG: HD domain-containing protein, partial [Candidatus Brockarchaeota archaeon]|nr:HD domain-containing protein [Candidatus Brockarchaeota archaeon]